MITMKKLLLTTIAAATVLVAAQAHAERLKDDMKYVRKELCLEGLSAKECLNSVYDTMARNLGYEEAALEVCPDLYVADPQLRAVRRQKYLNYRYAYKEGWDHVIESYRWRMARGKEEAIEQTCRIAADDNTPTLGPVYGASWLGRRP
jgi:hypothetical protein